MGRIPGMTLVELQRAIGMLEAGMSLTDVALHFNRHVSTIQLFNACDIIFKLLGPFEDLGKRHQRLCCDVTTT